MPLGPKTEGEYAVWITFYYKNIAVATFPDHLYAEWRREYKDQKETGIPEQSEFIISKLKMNGNKCYVLPGAEL